MGVVVQARDSELGRDVALKLLISTGSEDAERRLVREAQAMAQLSHPNVVTVHAVGRYRNGVYIAMELVRGSTLRTWCEDRSRTWTEVVEVFARAGEGLAAAHGVGLVHRDFKPDNVLVSHDGEVLVSDFGLAGVGHHWTASRDHESLEHESLELDTDLTRTGVVMGTPRFMSPEQYEGSREVDARADQFAFWSGALPRALWRLSLLGRQRGGAARECERRGAQPAARSYGRAPGGVADRAAMHRSRADEALPRDAGGALRPTTSTRRTSSTSSLHRVWRDRRIALGGGWPWVWVWAMPSRRDPVARSSSVWPAYGTRLGRRGRARARVGPTMRSRGRRRSAGAYPPGRLCRAVGRLGSRGMRGDPCPRGAVPRAARGPHALPRRAARGVGGPGHAARLAPADEVLAKAVLASASLPPIEACEDRRPGLRAVSPEVENELARLATQLSLGAYDDVEQGAVVLDAEVTEPRARARLLLIRGRANALAARNEITVVQLEAGPWPRRRPETIVSSRGPGSTWYR